MLVNNILCISERFTKYSYFELKLQLDSPPDKWKTAVEILQDRINGRYFIPITNLLRKQGDKHGFVAMSLICLLIDTFMQFENGFPQSSDSNRRFYVEFMRDSLKVKESLANRFYTDIRCGLLHSAETKNGSYLVLDSIENGSVDEDAFVALIDEGRGKVLVVSVRKMFNKLKSYFDGYWHKLLELDNVEYTGLRANFIAKMDFITMKMDNVNKSFELWNAIGRNAGKRLIAKGDRSRNRFFTYEKDYEQVALIIKRPLMIEDIVIPFADIKEMAICGNINDANRRRTSTNQIKYSAYILSILESCPDEVRDYVNNVSNVSNTTGYAL